MESRIAELEIRLILAEDHVEELNRSVFRQQQQIDLLQAQLRELHRILPGAVPDAAATARNLRDEIPPHY